MPLQRYTPGVSSPGVWTISEIQPHAKVILAVATGHLGVAKPRFDVSKDPFDVAKAYSGVAKPRLDVAKGLSAVAARCCKAAGIYNPLTNMDLGWQRLALAKPNRLRNKQCGGDFEKNKKVIPMISKDNPTPKSGGKRGRPSKASLPPVQDATYSDDADLLRMLQSIRGKLHKLTTGVSEISQNAGDMVEAAADFEAVEAEILEMLRNLKSRFEVIETDSRTSKVSEKCSRDMEAARTGVAAEARKKDQREETKKTAAGSSGSATISDDSAGATAGPMGAELPKMSRNGFQVLREHRHKAGNLVEEVTSEEILKIKQRAAQLETLDGAMADSTASPASNPSHETVATDTAEPEIVDLTEIINRAAEQENCHQDRAPVLMDVADLPAMAKDPLDALLLEHVRLFNEEFRRGSELVQPDLEFWRRIASVDQATPFSEHVGKIAEHVRKYQGCGRQEVVKREVSGTLPRRDAKTPSRAAKGADENSADERMRYLEKFDWRKEPWKFLAYMAKDPLERLQLQHIFTFDEHVRYCFRAVSQCVDPDMRIKHIKQAQIYSVRILKIAEQLRKHRVKGRQEIIVEQMVIQPAVRSRQRPMSAARRRKTVSHTKSRLAG